MITVNIHEAKAKLSECVAALERGEAVLLARRNVPVVVRW
ncbi:MAG: type II toxin-antitoxin system Phd/YefM family antitoxin [Gammaproteobacteria bacterium]|nr:type II toxin-antitoxin system Phd/YefM family antitoxin [Gammaproteobacteria bacterium]